MLDREAVRGLLKERERSSAWLARQLRMNESLMSRYLSGDRPAPADLADRIAEVLEVPAHTLRAPESLLRPRPEPEPAGSPA